MPVVIPGSPFPINFADSASLTAFGKLATSQAQVLFNSQQQYGDDTTVWESAFVGTGANTFLPAESTIQMSTGGTANLASAIRQSRLFHRYTPGQEQVVFMSFCMDAGATITNNTRRVGYFDASNGIFLEVAGSTVSVVSRTNTSGSPSDAAKVAQASWNVDTFGAGALNPSGVTIDWTKTQILVIDLQWLGVGRVRIGFDIAGVFYPAHYFSNANSLTKVYMTTANLPCRLENFNTGTATGTATLRHICAAVTTGGGAEANYGHQFSYGGGGATATTLNTSSGRIPIISLQAKTTGPNSVRNTGQIVLKEYDTVVAGNGSLYWELVLNGTLTGSAYSSFATNSIANVDRTATAISGGAVLDSGYLNSSGGVRSTAEAVSNVKQLILSYSGLLSVQDQITLVATAVNNTSVACNFKWLELW